MEGVASLELPRVFVGNMMTCHVTCVVYYNFLFLCKQHGQKHKDSSSDVKKAIVSLNYSGIYHAAISRRLAISRTSITGRD